MTNPVIYPSNLTWLGLAKESPTAYGTPIAAPTIWVPLFDPSWKPDQKVLTNEAMYGDMAKVHGAANGPRADTMSYSTYLFLDTLFPHLLALLGGEDSLSGSADPYTHKTALLNTGVAQPPSYTLFLYNGAECWQMAGSIETKVDVDLPAEELGKLAVEWMGLPAVKMVTPPSNTPSTASPWAASSTVVTINGVAATTYTSVKMSYAREVTAVQTADGTAAPYIIFAGPLGGELEVDGVYQGYAGAPADLQNFLTDTHVPVVIKVSPNNDVVHYASWQHSVCAVTSSEVKSTAGKFVEIASKYTAISNATDALSGGTSPVQFKMLTPVSTAY